jgi:hypothetical protein
MVHHLATHIGTVAAAELAQSAFSVANAPSSRCARSLRPCLGRSSRATGRQRHQEVH